MGTGTSPSRTERREQSERRDNAAKRGGERPQCGIQRPGAPSRTERREQSEQRDNAAEGYGVRQTDCLYKHKK
ncbi:hypothetical protein FACS1894196_2790 [Clostridia bacterium]|nr:hypothetical protein FACS1894196_2790 [Clostridia bacterium]